MPRARPADAEIRDEHDKVTARVVSKIVMLALATPSTHQGWQIFTRAEAERAGLGPSPDAPAPSPDAVVQPKIKTCGSPELHAPMCMLLLARQCGNCPTTGSKATKIAYKLTNDKGSVKTMNRLTHGINVAQMELICYGVTSPHWGEAAVKYPYRLANSSDFVAPLAGWSCHTSSLTCHRWNLMTIGISRSSMTSAARWTGTTGLVASPTCRTKRTG